MRAEDASLTLWMGAAGGALLLGDVLVAREPVVHLPVDEMVPERIQVRMREPVEV
jgi:hypothetical protein